MWKPGVALTGMILVAILLHNVTLTYTQPGPSINLNDCITAAICNLIKGDVFRESEGHPGIYYGIAEAQLNRSIASRNCKAQGDSTFQNCIREREKCESDIDVFARNILGIPLPIFDDCPYETWPYMIFLCDNYKYWPDFAISEIPGPARSCGVQCSLIEDFETWHRMKGRTEFPSNWEQLKNVSKYIKEKYPKPEARQQKSKIYPWAGYEQRQSSQVGPYLQRFNDNHGVLAPPIVCPLGHYFDSFEEVRKTVTSPDNWTHSVVRFGCTALNGPDVSENNRLWTDPPLSSPTRTSCWRKGQNNLMVSIATYHSYSSITTTRPFKRTTTWTADCRNNNVDERNQTYECPSRTAICGIQLVLDPKHSPPVAKDVKYGCCNIPTALDQCNHTVLTMEPVPFVCTNMTDLLMRCSVDYTFGLVLNGKPDTSTITQENTRRYKKIFKNIMDASNAPKSILKKFDWPNVPDLAPRMVLTVSTEETVEKNVRFTRHQPTITCGSYSIRSMDLIRNFVSVTNNITQDYIKNSEEGCFSGLEYTIDVDPNNCVDRPNCEFNPPGESVNSKLSCADCTKNYFYGIFPPTKFPSGSSSSETTTADLSQKFESILSAYKLVSDDADKYNWTNVPKISDGKTNASLEVKNLDLELLLKGDYAQRHITCGGWKIISPDIVKTSSFGVDGTKGQGRKFETGFLEAIKVELGCTPMYRIIPAGKFSDENIRCFNCTVNIGFRQQFGFEISADIKESSLITRQKLNMIARAAKMLPNNARLYNWLGVASVPKVVIDTPRVSYPRDRYRVPLHLDITPSDVTITCGGYKLYADFVKDIGCVPLYFDQPVLPVCTGCKLNPNWISLPGRNYSHYYINCLGSAQCTWTTLYGYENSDPTEGTAQILRRLETLAKVAPGFTDSRTHHTPNVLYDWADLGRAGGLMRKSVVYPGFDRAVWIPTLTCGSLKLYSGLTSYTMFLTDGINP